MSNLETEQINIAQQNDSTKTASANKSMFAKQQMTMINEVIVIACIQQFAINNRMDILHSNRLDNGQNVFYSIVEKQSQKGFSMNKRLLLMLQNHFISYLSQPNIHFPFTHDYISKNAKMIVPLPQINKVIDRHENQKIIIHFWVYQKQRKVEKSWSIKFNNNQLLQKWLEKFEEFTNRSRNNTLERNGSISLKLQNHQNSAGSSKKIPYINSSETLKNQFRSQPNNGALVNSTPQSNGSFFSNKKDVRPQIQNMINFQNSKINDRSIYFSNNSNFLSTQRYNFKNYFRPYLDSIIKNPNNITKMNQLNEATNKFNKFVQYCKESVINLVEDKLQKLKELERHKDIKLRIQQDRPNWIRYSQIEDIDIQLGLIQLKNVKNDNYVCDGALTKIAMNNLKNLQYLYEVIGRDAQLINTFYIPMACVVSYKGYTCFAKSKIVHQEQPNQQEVDSREASKMFDKLSSMAKIGFEIFENERNIQFLPKNGRRDKFVIMHAQTYLAELENCLIIRKQSFTMIYPEHQNESYASMASKKQNQYQINKIFQYLQEKIAELSDLMNKLEIYPVSPSEMAQILHCFGINVKYLSHLYNRITQSYIQGIIKTDAALRVFKLIFNKKLQQNLGRNKLRDLSEETGKQLLNILLGVQQSSSQLWKVICLHSQMYFSLSVEQSQINKGYLLLGLSYYLDIQILSNYSSIQKIFKTKSFVQGIKFHAKVKPINILPSFLKPIQEQYDITLNEVLFNKIVTAFDLQDQNIPSFISNYPYLQSKILYLLSFYIRPNDRRYQHLKIYQIAVSSQFQKMNSLNYFWLQKSMTQIKWQIRNGSKSDYILMLINKIRDTIQNYYGKSHPFISQIYELQSLYFLQIFEEQQAININKESLSNMIQCCGNNNRHIKISNSYYQLGECLKKCYRFQQAILNYKKSKNILQINSYQNLPEYAHILYKLGLMYLLQNKDVQSYQLFIHAIAIYEHASIYNYWEFLVELYEAINRCQVKITNLNRVNVILTDIKLAEHCITQLEKILVVEMQFQICSDEQFIRVFKIIIEHYVNYIKKQEKSVFKNYIIELCEYFGNIPQAQIDVTLSQSIIYFKNLITVGRFCELIQNYMSQSNEILLRLKNQKRIGKLIPYKRNDLIENYDQFMKNLVVIVGEPFILNIF